jgi:predicted CXXCH cytochrome family protein
MGSHGGECGFSARPGICTDHSKEFGELKEIVKRARRANKVGGIIVVAAVVALAGLWTLSALAPGTASAAGPSPHVSIGATTDNCATCHRIHTAQNSKLLKSTPESALCLSCHDGTGSQYNVAAEYSDPNVPANDAATSSYYSHPLDLSSTHTSAQVDEFGGVFNRHSACSDCHNPHSMDGSVPQETSNGWTASGALKNISGVSTPLAWQNPVTYEYELCLKCHSRYTVLLSSSTATYNKTDMATELDPTNASYHPVEAPGKNTSAQLQNSLNGGKLWQMTTGSTVRCTQCHGNYRLVGNPPTLNSPTTTALLAPHASMYRSLLIANYRDRTLKSASEAYNTNDFALCYLCHSEAPFSTSSTDPRTDTNFEYHGMHLNSLSNGGSGGTDINVPGDGQGNAICAECHFDTHGTKLAPWPGNQNYAGGVNFAPNVQPEPGQLSPIWDSSSRTCTLVCHGYDHNPTNAGY